MHACIHTYFTIGRLDLSARPPESIAADLIAKTHWLSVHTLRPTLISIHSCFEGTAYVRLLNSAGVYSCSSILKVFNFSLNLFTATYSTLVLPSSSLQALPWYEYVGYLVSNSWWFLGGFVLFFAAFLKIFRIHPGLQVGYWFWLKFQAWLSVFWKVIYSCSKCWTQDSLLTCMVTLSKPYMNSNKRLRRIHLAVEVKGVETQHWKQ